MSLAKLVVGQLQTNCYLVYSKPGSEAFIIDPGDDADYIIRKIQDLNLKPKSILATHGHFDHILAVSELKLAFDIPFLLHKNDLAIIKRTQSTAKFFTGLKVDPCPMPDKYLSDNQVLKIDNLSLKVITTPGHTKGSACFYNFNQGVIFTGDTIFSDGNYGRVDLKGGNIKDIKKSIQAILNLPSDTFIYSGHGRTTTIGKERNFHKLA